MTAPTLVEAPPETREQFIARLTRIRKHRGLPQTLIASRIGTRQQTLSMWESGAKRPGRKGLRAWAEALGVDPYPEAVAPVRDVCGTARGYQRHRRRREKPCDPCIDANTRYIAVYREVKRLAAEAEQAGAA